jgi:hypothetical protein
MKDKRDECGCHRNCTTEPHDCELPCRWPDCLTREEELELLRALADRALADDGLCSYPEP